MKIAYVARRRIPSVSANSVQIVEMCEAFADLGHEVVLFARPGDAPRETIFSRYGVKPNFAIQVHPPKKGKAGNIRFAGGLIRYCRNHKPDVFYGRDINSLALIGWLGRRVVYEAHMLPRRGSIRWRLLSSLLRRPNFSHLVCVTSTLAELHRRQFPALATKHVIVAPNAGAEPTRSPPVQGWPGRAEALQVGFVGRPFPGKGIETIVAAARQLGEVDFHVVGAERADVTWINGEVPRNVYFHGYRAHARLASYFDRFDIAAAPYCAEVMNASGLESAAITSPLKLLGYMAAGLPTIVSDLPGVRDMLKEDCVVEIVSPGDEDEFVAAIRKLQADPKLRAELGAAARRRFEEHHAAIARARAVLAPLANGSLQ